MQRYHKLRCPVDEDPPRIMTNYTARLRDMIGMEEDQPWTMMGVNRRREWECFADSSTCTTSWRRWVFQRLDQGEYLAVRVLGRKCAHQEALEQGSFEKVLLLTGLPEPLRRKPFGGEPLEIIGQYVKGLEEVEKRTVKTPAPSDEEEKEKPKQRPPRGRKGGTGKKGGGKDDKA